MKVMQLFRTLMTVLGIVMIAASTASSRGTPRAAIVEEVRNDEAGFMVRVDVDHANRIYRENEELKVSVKSEKAGYLYLVYTRADNKVSVLFPNKFQPRNYIPAAQVVHVPPQRNATFRIRIGRPLGDEVLTAIVSSKPIKNLDAKSLTDSVATEVSYETVKAAFVEAVDAGAGQVSEHHVRIKTVAASTRVGVHTPRRFGVFIGLSQFRDRSIPQLSICHVDAQTMCDVMTPGLDQTFVLTNQEATLSNIEDCVRRKLVQMTKPGDEVFIYWSGHGGRCADLNGDEPDGLDEYLVTFDSYRNQYSTMLLDDQFGRWVQELDGRKVVVILDTCHSAGSATNEKGLGAPGVKAIGGPADFLDGEFARAKDIGQKETAILASSRAAQVSFERRQGDLSAMTYYLTQLLRQNRNGVTLDQAYQHVKLKVPQYVGSAFPGSTQDPVLVNETTPPVYLVPRRS